MNLPRSPLLLAAALVGACGGGGGGRAPIDADSDSSADGDSGGDGAVALRAQPGPARYALVGGDVVLDGSASVGAQRYQWYFGDGRGWAAPRPGAVDHVTYDQPGRYQAVLTVFDDAGNRTAAGVIISVTFPAVDVGSASSTLAAMPDGGAVVVSADADQLIVIGRDAGDVFSVVRRVDTCHRPRTVAVWQGFLVTACQAVDRLGFYPLDGVGAPIELPLPYGSAPFGVAALHDAAFVSLQGTAMLAEIRLQDGAPVLRATYGAVQDARGVAPLPDGSVAVTRWRSPDFHAEVDFFDPATGKSALVTLALDHRDATAAAIGGIPTYLGQIAVSPTGREAVVPSLMANFGQGSFLAGVPLTFDSTVRAALSRIDLVKKQELFPGRIQFPGAGLAVAAAFSSRGDYAYVVMPGNRLVARVDLLTGVTAGSFVDAGLAPDGALVTADDRFLLVNAPLSRELVVYALASVAAQAGAVALAVPAQASPVARVPLLLVEPLEATVLRGAQLFNDAADPRLAKDGYLACAHCHLDGDADQRVWDFSDRGEGLRNTISLRGRAGTGDGPLNWSANSDEVQDVEGDIRQACGGAGLMTDDDLAVGTRSSPLGDAKGGVSADLDALAAYVASLRDQPRSPYRTADGALGEAATRGKTLFESAALGCQTCHSGPRLTDSQFVTPGQPLLHDVGTLGPGSGQRLGSSLTGLDTPTLHGLWQSAPYLHDGSAATLGTVLRTRNVGDRHGVTAALSDADLGDLIAYLLSLDRRVD
ncbi:MAG: hypothetical protein QOI66_4461 [Myxococcales bacterium]|nr:hypothetical protein [Myxococcales bacterium]